MLSKAKKRGKEGLVRKMCLAHSPNQKKKRTEAVNEQQGVKEWIMQATVTRGGGEGGTKGGNNHSTYNWINNHVQ